MDKLLMAMLAPLSRFGTPHALPMQGGRSAWDLAEEQRQRALAQRLACWSEAVHARLRALLQPPPAQPSPKAKVAAQGQARMQWM